MRSSIQYSVDWSQVEQEHWSNPEVDQRNDPTRFRVTGYSKAKVRREREDDAT